MTNNNLRLIEVTFTLFYDHQFRRKLLQLAAYLINLPLRK